MANLWQKYKLRQLRRYTLWRSFRSRRNLTAVLNQTGQITSASILCVMCVRNEALRLPFFLEYHRDLGVDHFLIVDNGSTDGTVELLKGQVDVSLWTTGESYRAARYGLDWTTWLQMKYARGKWCLTLDADELLTFAHQDTRSLRDLTKHLETVGQSAMGALMIDLYPKGPIDQTRYIAGNDPRDILSWFDAGPYRSRRQEPKENLWVQGGARERVFFSDEPSKSPTLNKLPLVKWNVRFAYTNSTHAILPPKLNHCYNGPGDGRVCGALLHTKFLPIVIEKSQEDLMRQQHFSDPSSFVPYYDHVISGADLWWKGAEKFENWEQLERLGLMSRGTWA